MGTGKDTFYRSFHGLRPPPIMKTESAQLCAGEQPRGLHRDGRVWMCRGAGLGRGWQELNSSSPQPSPPPKRGGREGEDLARFLGLAAMVASWHFHGSRTEVAERGIEGQGSFDKDGVCTRPMD